MRKIEMNTKLVRKNNIVFVFIFFLFGVFALRLAYLCLVDYKVGKVTISDFITNRNIKSETILPTRGGIYDKNGNVLAQDVASYSVIAYLDSSRSEGSKIQLHVSDVEATATALSPYLNTDVDTLKEILSRDAYQVELGSGSRNLSQIEMENIKNLNLPGIDFIKSTKRYYSNGDFASYLLGYTVNTEDKDKNLWKVGEMGIEEYYNKELTGTSGFVTYEKDRYGYKIANGREYKEDAINGSNIYLTIDDNIQLFAENAVKKASSDSEAEWVLMVIADAKTGAILGYTSTPSFNPNDRDMTSYLNPIVNYNYEPGSTMKIFSYMCAIESGNYNGQDTYLSGSKTYTSETTGEETTINDWYKPGWGYITYDQGFALSSNIAVANLVETFINKKDLKACYQKYGFGQATGFTLAREQKGSIDFNYQIEVATAGYGQGITTTPIQYIQALTSLANDGNMLKPYVVSKIVDSNTGKTTFEGEKKVIGKVASTETVTKMKELMRSVINPDGSVATGSLYYMDGYDLIGKTGTAQIFDYEHNQYMTGWSDYIYSFAGLYPGDDPNVIVYMALKKPKDTTNYIAPAIREVIVNVSKYLNLKMEEEVDTSYKITSYTNKNTLTTRDELLGKGLNVLVLGTGDKIINQYPGKNNIVNSGDLVVLLTNNYNKEMVDLTGLSYKEANNILKLMGANYKLLGKGYVTSQSVAPGTVIDMNTVVEVNLQEKYNIS